MCKVFGALMVLESPPLDSLEEPELSLDWYNISLPNLGVKHILGTELNHAQQIVVSVTDGSVFIGSSTLLDNQLIQSQLLSSTFNDFFFNGVLCYESEDMNLFLLANSMGSIHGL
ncbi:hypothetical protein WICPIJ_006396 [Wickerhamomyces pijperi]|uniref:Uncharacterized protein n=1 Tax=Wickerhamomyces pijperi TaxID=599730 RepID=A0A9P8Q1U4_WICPI|nr:hypothetical protein WICPIJ_006396 [Wickerhamomyces pijperi]